MKSVLTSLKIFGEMGQFRQWSNSEFLVNGYSKVTFMKLLISEKLETILATLTGGKSHSMKDFEHFEVSHHDKYFQY